MSDATQPAAETPTPAPQTLTQFQQQIAMQLLANMKAASDALVDSMKEQQTKFETQTLELLQALKLPIPPSAISSQQTGETGQPQAKAQPAAPAGPT